VSDLIDHRYDADLAGLGGGDLPVGEVAADAYGLAGEVDVAPAQREQLAAAQAREGGGEVDGGVLVVGGAADDGVDLLASVHVVVAGVADGVALDAVDRLAAMSSRRWAYLRIAPRIIRAWAAVRARS
jgi:hypothetical protein